MGGRQEASKARIDPGLSIIEVVFPQDLVGRKSLSPREGEEGAGRDRGGEDEVFFFVFGWVREDSGANKRMGRRGILQFGKE